MSATVTIATSTRAEWGLLRPFARELGNCGAEVRVVATGMHLSTAFGATWQEIENDGYAIDERIPIMVDGDDALAESQNMALALLGFASYFARRPTDALLVLGDRYEMLAIAEAAFLARIPVIHIHGGEVTEGAIDDGIRNCITKLATLHLTSTEEYRQRVIQMGESPDRVFNVGSVGVENAMSLPLLPYRELVTDLGLVGIGRYAVMTYHPVTLGEGKGSEELDVVLNALSSFDGLDIIATRANADAGGRAINARLDEWAKVNPKMHVFSSLGSLRYMSALKYASVVVGNSSSGIFEAPVFRTPVINVGDRQKGRVRPPGVIDVPLDADAIEDAIGEVLGGNHQTESIKGDNPYGHGDTSRISARIIMDALENGMSSRKRFYDIVGGQQ